MAGKDFSSTFRTGPMVKGDGNRNQISEYITIFGKKLSTESAFVQGKWDWTNSSASKKWSSEQQVYTVNRTNRSLSRKRIMVRGTGPSLQLQFRSETGKPFNIVGWTMWDSVDAVT